MRWSGWRTGFAPSANLGDNYAVFEPTHGSAPKYAGQYKVNPIEILLTSKLMLDWLKEEDKAKHLEDAVARVIAEGKVRTYDMGGKDSTLDVAKAIADYPQRLTRSTETVVGAAEPKSLRADYVLSPPSPR